MFCGNRLREFMVCVGDLGGGNNQNPLSALQKSSWESCEVRSANRGATSPTPGQSSTLSRANPSFCLYTRSLPLHGDMLLPMPAIL